MQPSAANNAIISSDTPLDKIVYMDSGSFSVPTGSFLEINVPHTLGFRPLIICTWSTDPNFTVSYEAGTSGYASMSVPQLTAQAMPNSIRFLPLNQTGSNLTYYWRVFGFMPSDVDVDAPFTATIADSFALNTDYNYTKLWKEDVILWTPGTQAVDHNFGYRPQVDIWFEQELNADLLSRWYQGMDTSYLGTDNVRITDTQVLFDFRSSGGVSGRKWYYRIYLDTGVGT